MNSLGQSWQSSLSRGSMLFYLLLLGGVSSTAAAQTPGERPNILVCMADDASWPYCGAYGCPALPPKT